MMAKVVGSTNTSGAYSLEEVSLTWNSSRSAMDSLDINELAAGLRFPSLTAVFQHRSLGLGTFKGDIAESAINAEKIYSVIVPILDPEAVRHLYQLSREGLRSYSFTVVVRKELLVPSHRLLIM